MLAFQPQVGGRLNPSLPPCPPPPLAERVEALEQRVEALERRAQQSSNAAEPDEVEHLGQRAVQPPIEHSAGESATWSGSPYEDADVLAHDGLWQEVRAAWISAAQPRRGRIEDDAALDALLDADGVAEVLEEVLDPAEHDAVFSELSGMYDEYGLVGIDEVFAAACKVLGVPAPDDEEDADDCASEPPASEPSAELPASVGPVEVKPASVDEVVEQEWLRGAPEGSALDTVQYAFGQDFLALLSRIDQRLGVHSDPNAVPDDGGLQVVRHADGSESPAYHPAALVEYYEGLVKDPEAAARPYWEFRLCCRARVVARGDKRWAEAVALTLAQGMVRGALLRSHIGGEEWEVEIEEPRAIRPPEGLPTYDQLEESDQVGANLSLRRFLVARSRLDVRAGAGQDQREVQAQTAFEAVAAYCEGEEGKQPSLVDVFEIPPPGCGLPWGPETYSVHYDGRHRTLTRLRPS